HRDLARRGIDRVDLRKRVRSALESRLFVGYLNPLIACEAEHDIFPETLDCHLAAVDIGYSRFNRRVVARPLEGRLIARTAGVNLHPVQLILQPGISGAWRKKTGVLLIRRRLRSRVERSSAQRVQLIELSQRRLTSHISRRALWRKRKELDLEHVLNSGRGVWTAECDFPD